MKNKLTHAFSLIEIMAVLALFVLLLGICSSEFKFDINLQTTKSQLTKLLHDAQQIAIQKQENIFLIKEKNNILIYNQYGQILVKQKLKSEITFYDAHQNVCHTIKIFPSGFTSNYTIELDGQKKILDPLSLCLKN